MYIVKLRNKTVFTIHVLETAIYMRLMVDNDILQYAHFCCLGRLL